MEFNHVVYEIEYISRINIVHVSLNIVHVLIKKLKPKGKTLTKAKTSFGIGGQVELHIVIIKIITEITFPVVSQWEKDASKFYIKRLCLGDEIMGQKISD